MSLALATNVDDEEPGEDGGPSDEDVMRQMGFGHLLSNQVSNQGKEVEKISNTTILVQDSSSVSTLVNNPSLDLPGIELPRSASVDVTTPEHSSSRTEFDSSNTTQNEINDPSFVFDSNEINSSDSEAIDDPDSVRPRFDLEEEIVSIDIVNESTVGLPERPAVTKRKKMEEWKRNKVKKFRLEGKSYTSLERKIGKEGKIVKNKKDRKERNIRPVCNSVACLKSSKRHCMQIPETARNSMFKRFWSMTWGERKTYVASLVTSTNKKQIRRKESGDRRSISLHYHLIIEESKKEVCKKTFLNTFDIGEWAVRNWVMNSEHGMSIRNNAGLNKETNDKRNSVQGKSDGPSTQGDDNENNGNVNPPRATKTNGKPRAKLFAVDFLSRLPKMESHYCRKDTSKLYLEPIIKSGQELFNLYLEDCKTHNKIPLCRFTFMELVTSMNISLFQTKKDQCDVCSEHRVGNISEEEYKDHERAKKEARDEKEADKVRADKGECNVYTVDLQQVKLAPSLKASALYYKTKLCCHNHTYFNLSTKQVCCYWWNESEGEIKATNFTSCVLDFLEKEIAAWPQEKPKHIILWSDGCVYQNKNKTLANALLNLAMRTTFLIEQKYLEKGHTQMEADSVHAAIERRLRNREIHHSHDYLTVTREARNKPFPYMEKCLNHEFFRNYEIPEGQAYSSIRPRHLKNDPTVNNVVQLTYKVEGIFFKLQFSSNLQKLPQRKKLTLLNIVYPGLYSSQLKLSHIKWQHLQELKRVLPQHVHQFYDDLPHHGKIDESKSGRKKRM